MEVRALRVGRTDERLQRAAPATHPVLRESPLWPRVVIEDIQTKAELGRYRMQGFSMTAACRTSTI